MQAPYKRFVSWSAVSSLPQAKKISLEEQQQINKEHVAKWTGVLVEELTVPGESRDIVLFEEAARRMDAYRRLHELIEAKAFDVLIFLNMGRLGRDAALSMAVVRLCQRAGIALYSTESPPQSLDPSDSYSDSLINAVKAVGYQQEIAELKRRNKIGMAERVRRGDFPHKIPWPWIRLHNADGTERFEVDKTGAEALDLIQAAYLVQGLGAERIAQLLNEQGYPSPDGKEWTYGSVSYVIANCWRYAGYIEYNRRSQTGREYIKAESNAPAIWSDEVARAIEAERHRRWTARGSVHSKHRFSQAVYCSVCGRRMRAAFRTCVYRKGMDNEQRYDYEDYRCGGNHPTGKNIPAHRISAAVEELLEYLESLENLENYLPQQEDLTEQLQSQLADAEQQLVTLQSQLERADDAHVAGVMDAQRYQRQVQRIQKQRQTTQSRINELQTAVAEEAHSGDRLARLEELIVDGWPMLETADIPTANAFFRHHLEIWVDHGRVAEIKAI